MGVMDNLLDALMTSCSCCLLLDDDQEGVMDNLLEALKTGSAFAVGRENKGRKRTPRAAGGE